jgi:hypothetical protein
MRQSEACRTTGWAGTNRSLRLVRRKEERWSLNFPTWLYDLLMVPFDAIGMRAIRCGLLEGLSGRVLEIGAGTGGTGATVAGGWRVEGRWCAI